MSLPPLVPVGPDLTAADLRRYSRHVLIPEIGAAGQRRLRNAKVLVVGAGGLGSPALAYLAAAGVGTIGVVDPDVVDESNLQRQVIHRQSALGRPKVLSAAESLAEVNPLVTIVPHQERLSTDNASALVAAYDLVVDGSDNFATRYLVSDACVLAGKPDVWGSVLRFDGQVSVFWAEHGPCYRCLFPDPPPPGAVPSCAEAGVLGALCGLVGSAQAVEAISLITGTGEPLVGRLLLCDGLTMRWHELPHRKDPQCATCGSGASSTQVRSDELGVDRAGVDSTEAAISVTTLATWLGEREQGSRDFLLVDVREPAEFRINRIPGSVLIPMAGFLSGAAFDQLPTDRPVVLHCKVGARSAAVLAVLKSAGFADAVHVAGGIAAWVEEIDPSQPSY